MNTMLDLLERPAFHLGQTPTTWVEVFAFLTGALCVWLVAKQHVANWAIGIVNAALFLALFNRAGLFADSALQVVYIALGAYGWWAWLHADHRHRIDLPVSRTTPAQWATLAALGIAGTALLTGYLDHHTSSVVPFWDALTTALSLLATWGQTRKKVESWWIWISADLVYVPLYGYKDLWLTAVLYVGFLALCVKGLREWRADLAQSTTTEAILVPA